MNLWWLYLPSDTCSFTEITRRQCVAIGWSELGPLDKYIKDKPNWERQFKSYIQVKGDLAYSTTPRWKEKDREFDQIPDIFWRMLQINRGDLIVAVESGSELTLGRTVIRGIGRASQDALTSYEYEAGNHHAHTVCPDTRWFAWDRFKMGELHMPTHSFRTLCIENNQLETALDGWKKGVEEIRATKAS